MLRKLGIPALALAALMTIVPAASAGVRFRVGIGGPVYAPAPYYGYYYNPYYAYPAYPYVGVYGGWGWHGHYHRHWR